MDRLIPVRSRLDVPQEFRLTPIEDFLAYHNCGETHPPYDHPSLLLSKCIDYRERVRIPERFAYVIRTGGANLHCVEFQVSYAIAVAGIRAIALVGHTNCAMVNLMSKHERFVSGLIEVGWKREYAESHFLHYSPFFEIGNEIDFLLNEAAHLRRRYPKVVVAPLMYRLEDGLVYVLKEDRLAAA